MFKKHTEVDDLYKKLKISDLNNTSVNSTINTGYLGRKLNVGNITSMPQLKRMPILPTK